jgi:hypothetical protein
MWGNRAPNTAKTPSFFGLDARELLVADGVLRDQLVDHSAVPRADLIVEATEQALGIPA